MYCGFYLSSSDSSSEEDCAEPEMEERVGPAFGASDCYDMWRTPAEIQEETESETSNESSDTTDTSEESSDYSSDEENQKESGEKTSKADVPESRPMEVNDEDGEDSLDEDANASTGSQGESTAEVTDDEVEENIEKEPEGARKEEEPEEMGQPEKMNPAAAPTEDKGKQETEKANEDKDQKGTIIVKFPPGEASDFGVEIRQIILGSFVANLIVNIAPGSRAARAGLEVKCNFLENIRCLSKIKFRLVTTS